MTKKKGKFLTFIFSFLPGAGEMYMGFMKMGVSLMSIFFGIIAVGGFFGSSVVMLASVVVWFYSFFHANNLRAMEDEDFYALEDHYLISFDKIVAEAGGKEFISRYRKVLAVVLLLLGTSIIWNNLSYFLRTYFPKYNWMISNFAYRVPQFVLGVGIIAVGILLIRGKKQELLEETEEEDDGREEND